MAKYRCDTVLIEPILSWVSQSVYNPVSKQNPALFYHISYVDSIYWISFLNFFPSSNWLPTAEKFQIFFMKFSSRKCKAVPRVSGLSRFATAPLFDSPLNGFHAQIMIAHLEFILFENQPNKNERPYLSPNRWIIPISVCDPVLEVFRKNKFFTASHFLFSCSFVGFMLIILECGWRSTQLKHVTNIALFVETKLWYTLTNRYSMH